MFFFFAATRIIVKLEKQRRCDMREIVLEDNPSKRQIFVDDNKPGFSYLSNKDIDLYISLLEIEMYEHFKNRRKRKPRDQPENKKIS